MLTLPLHRPLDIAKLTLAVLSAFAISHSSARAALAQGKLRLEFQSAPAKASKGRSVTRLDLLLSGLALKRADGSWLESADWFAFVSPLTGHSTAEGDGVPVTDFTAIRFTVGLPEAIDKADAAQWPAGHALHPEFNGMHWGWQGGYVFVALEGRNGADGFSYHLAGTEARRTVELPVRFSGGGPITIGISIHADAWLAEVEPKTAPNSTHSRPGDDFAVSLANQTQEAFTIEGVKNDVFHPAAKLVSTKAPAGTTPYPLAISERFPPPALPADNPLTTGGVSLGKALFHDVRLSRINTQSCASCHKQSLAFSDDKDLSIGGEGQLGTRNSMPLFNLAWSKAFFWDGRAKTLREQVLMPIQDKHEMNAPLDLVVQCLSADDEYSEQFKRAFGSNKITPELIAKALEQFLLTLISQDSKFDSAVRKQIELTAEEKRGLELFLTEHDPKRGLHGADCFHCHGGKLFTNHAIMNNGLRGEEGKFKVPSLRNVALTAPYMHDGRFNTLEQVIEHYSSGVQRNTNLDPNLAKHPATGIRLTQADQTALVAFLKTLTDEDFTNKADPNRQLATSTR